MKFLENLLYVAFMLAVLLLIRFLLGFEIAALFALADIAVDIHFIKHKED